MIFVWLLLAFGAGFFVGGRVVDRRADGLMRAALALPSEQQKLLLDEQQRKFPQ